MIILHGVYDHGKIEIKEKDLPDIKADVEISIPDTGKKSELKKLFQVSREKNLFQDIKNPVEWQRKIRNDW